MTEMTLHPLLVISGPTASGKSRLGLEVAEALSGEIISADSFAVYRGMDIGTDKPTSEMRRRVPHHLVDVASPHERFSAGDFADQASAKITLIRDRGHLPVVVGGTNFYIRALLLGLFPAPRRSPEIRERLMDQWRCDPAALVARLASVDPEAAARIHPRDRQRILRSLEVFEATGTPISTHWSRHQDRPRFHPLVAAPQHPRDLLYARIERRVDAMFSSGLIEEVRALLASGVPHEAHALKAIGYRQVSAYLRGEIDLETARNDTKKASKRLAKRQLTWLRHMREGTVHWIPPAEASGASDLITLWRDHYGGAEAS